MLVKMGVDYSRLKWKIRRTLNIVDDLFKEKTGIEAVLSSTYEGNHMPSSRHYCDLAVDFSFKIHNLDLHQKDDIRVAVSNELISRYGERKYDVLFSANDTALHIEYDPK